MLVTLEIKYMRFSSPCRVVIVVAPMRQTAKIEHVVLFPCVLLFADDGYTVVRDNGERWDEDKIHTETLRLAQKNQ